MAAFLYNYEGEVCQIQKMLMYLKYVSKERVLIVNETHIEMVWIPW